MHLQMKAGKDEEALATLLGPWMEPPENENDQCRMRFYYQITMDSGLKVKLEVALR